MDHMQRFLRFARSAGYSCLQLADAMDTRTLRVAESRVTSYLKSMQVVRPEEETLSETVSELVISSDLKSPEILFPQLSLRISRHFSVVISQN